MPVYGSFTERPIPSLIHSNSPNPPPTPHLSPSHTALPPWPLSAIRMGVFQFSIQALNKYMNLLTSESFTRCVNLYIQKGFPFLWGGGGWVGKGESRHFSRATRSVSCARFAHTLAKIIEKKNKKKKVWWENLAEGCDFRFNSTRPRATSIVICSKFGI